MTTKEATKTEEHKITASEAKKLADTVAVDALADKIRQTIEIDPVTGEVGKTENIFVDSFKAYETNLEEIARVERLRTHIAAASTKAIGLAGIDSMKDNPELNRVSGEIPLYGKDVFRVAVDRSGTVRNPKTGEVSTVHGVVRTEFVQTAGANRGVMSSVRTSLREAAEAALNKGK